MRWLLLIPYQWFDFCSSILWLDRFNYPVYFYTFTWRVPTCDWNFIDYKCLNIYVFCIPIHAEPSKSVISNEFFIYRFTPRGKVMINFKCYYWECYSDMLDHLFQISCVLLLIVYETLHFPSIHCCWVGKFPFWYYYQFVRIRDDLCMNWMCHVLLLLTSRSYSILATEILHIQYCYRVYRFPIILFENFQTSYC